MIEICDVIVPAGTVMDVSYANGIMGGYGGAVQFRFADDFLESWFINGRPY